MPLSETVLIVSGLLALAILVAGLCRSWPIPYSVVLVVLGMLLGELARVWEPEDEREATQSLALAGG
jgi:peptidoglycan/LPS O-acetylase OafA/YrhL